MIYRHALRPLLFRRDAERAHEEALALLARSNSVARRLASRPFTHPRLATEVAGLAFPNPIGLAAGCDKNALAVSIWPGFGFGAVEIGTITAQPQPGNPKPRLFRLPEQSAVINRLGFNSEGAEAVAARLARMRAHSPPLPVPLGINLGKTKIVTEDAAVLEDYRTGFRLLAPFADYITVNVSSPNTPGLRQWQERDRLTALLSALQEEAKILAASRTGTVQKPLPIFVKISPDMDDRDMDDVADVALSLGLAGIIATNTTLGRPGIAASTAHEGGLSGRPLRDRATEVIHYLYRRTEGRLPLIGVGGITTAEDAYARIRAGASLLQLYTALIYEGPYLARRINSGLLRLLERDQVDHLSQLVGCDV